MFATGVFLLDPHCRYIRQVPRDRVESVLGQLPKGRAVLTLFSIDLRFKEGHAEWALAAGDRAAVVRQPAPNDFSRGIKGRQKDGLQREVIALRQRMELVRMATCTTSDVDIGIKTSLKHGAVSVREKVEVAAEMEDLLGLGRVDLVILSEADPFLAANIVRGERIFANDSYAADEYELYILRRAGDLAPLERERLSMVFKEAG